MCVCKHALFYIMYKYCIYKMYKSYIYIYKIVAAIIQGAWIIFFADHKTGHLWCMRSF